MREIILIIRSSILFYKWQDKFIYSHKLILILVLIFLYNYNFYTYINKLISNYFIESIYIRLIV